MCAIQTSMIAQVALGQDTSPYINVLKFQMSLKSMPLGTCFGQVRSREPPGYLRGVGGRELRRVKESQAAKEGRFGFRSTLNHFPTMLEQNPFLGFMT